MAGYCDRIGIESCGYRVLARRPEGKQPIERLRRGLEVNVDWDVSFMSQTTRTYLGHILYRIDLCAEEFAIEAMNLYFHSSLKAGYLVSYYFVVLSGLMFPRK